MAAFSELRFDVREYFLPNRGRTFPVGVTFIFDWAANLVRFLRAFLASALDVCPLVALCLLFPSKLFLCPLNIGITTSERSCRRSCH